MDGAPSISGTLLLSGPDLRMCKTPNLMAYTLSSYGHPNY